MCGQMDTIRYVVPDLKEITNCYFYWGRMDHHEAEKLLEGKPEGTYLLRDSANDEYLFTITVRIKGRTLSARIEQCNNRFSFMSPDSSFYSSPSITGLINHYKTNSCWILDDAMLTIPFHRNFPLDLKQIIRASICSHLTQDSLSKLSVPNTLKVYLMEYHNKQKVRVDD